MSAKNRGGPSSDDRFTPIDLATALLGTIPLRPDMMILEPSAGEGAFLRALHHQCIAQQIDPRSMMVVAVEPNKRYHPELRRVFGAAGFTGYVYDGRLETLEAGTFHWSIGNQPYTYAEEHLRILRTCSTEGVANLLRLNLLGAEERIPLWRSHWPHVIVALGERPSFSGDGSTDATEYGWYLWRSGPSPDYARTFPLTWNWEKRPGLMESDLRRICGTVAELWSEDWREERIRARVIARERAKESA